MVQIIESGESIESIIEFLRACQSQIVRVISISSLAVTKRFIRALGRGFQMVFIKAAYYINQTAVNMLKIIHKTI